MSLKKGRDHTDDVDDAQELATYLENNWQNRQRIYDSLKNDLNIIYYENDDININSNDDILNIVFPRGGFLDMNAHGGYLFGISTILEQKHGHAYFFNIGHFENNIYELYLVRTNASLNEAPGNPVILPLSCRFKITLQDDNLDIIEIPGTTTTGSQNLANLIYNQWKEEPPLKRRGGKKRKTKVKSKTHRKK